MAGLGTGSFLGGVLPLASTHLNWERYSLNLIVMLAGFLWAGLFTVIWIRESHEVPYQGILGSFNNLPQVLGDAFQYGFRHPGLFLLMLATACWGFAIVGIENFWQPQVKTILNSEEQSWIFGLLSTGYFFAAACGNAIITPICKFFKNQYTCVLILFRITMGISFFVLAFQNGIWGFAFFYFFLFMQNGMLNSPHQSLFHQIVPNEKRSTLISLESLFMSIGAMAGGPSLGWIAQTESIAMTWGIAGTVFASSSLFYFLFGHLRKPM